MTIVSDCDCDCHARAEAALECDAAIVSRILQEVGDLSPWAYTYTERPTDLVEVRASELEAIVRAALEYRALFGTDEAPR